MPVAVIAVAVQPARREETPPASCPRVFYEAKLFGRLCLSVQDPAGAWTAKSWLTAGVD